MNFLSLASKGLILFVAVQHVFFLILEMFYWTKPLGLKVFKQTLAQAQASAVLAKNQGLYNGFLATGLFVSLAYAPEAQGKTGLIFFLGCVIVAGIYGGITAAKEILFVQALPAALALGLFLISNNIWIH